MSGSHIIGFDGQHIDREQFFGRGRRIPMGVIGERIVGPSKISGVAEGGIMDYQFVIKSGRRIRVQGDRNALGLR